VIRLSFSGSFTPPFSEALLETFIDINRLRNQYKGICGVLILMGSDFLQIIEGPEREVDALPALLTGGDLRASLTLLSRETISKPLFGAWSLGFLRASPPGEEKNEAEINMLQEIEQFDPENPQTRPTLDLIHEFIAGKWHRHVAGADHPVIVHRTKM